MNVWRLIAYSDSEAKMSNISVYAPLSLFLSLFLNGLHLFAHVVGSTAIQVFFYFLILHVFIWLTVCISHRQRKMLSPNRQQIPQMLKLLWPVRMYESHRCTWCAVFSCSTYDIRPIRQGRECVRTLLNCASIGRSLCCENVLHKWICIFFVSRLICAASQLLMRSQCAREHIPL